MLLAALVLTQLYALFVSIRSNYQPSPTAVGLYLLLVGSTFLASYFFSRKSFLFRWFLWFCEHASVPSGRKMAFFYFALCCFLGSIALLRGLGW